MEPRLVAAYNAEKHSVNELIASASREAQRLSEIKLKLPEIGVKTKLYIGVALAISSSIFIGLSYIIKKKGLQDSTASGKVIDQCNFLHEQSYLYEQS